MTTGIDLFFDAPQFSLQEDKRTDLLLNALNELTEFHRENSRDYKKITDSIEFSGLASDIREFPALPVSLFKSHLLSSIPDEDVFKVLTSSGTTGQQVSKVVLDRETAQLQAKALSSVMRRILGPKRLPMVLVDSKDLIKDRTMFSARGAGVLGMSQFGRDHFYALDSDMSLDLEGFEDFLTKHEGETILFFGFTFMVWEYLVEQLRKSNKAFNLTNAILVHSGGWKKLQDKAVSNDVFKAALGEVLGSCKVHNFYGMVEQVGGVFLEGDDGFLHPPNFSEVIIRNPVTWEEQPFGEQGIIETISILPRSYPGHVLLTEDLGVVHGIGDADAQWGGKQLEVIGRIPKAELRGCSDTHAFSEGVR